MKGILQIYMYIIIYLRTYTEIWIWTKK